MKLFLDPNGKPITNKPLLAALKDITKKKEVLKEGRNIYIKPKKGKAQQCKILVSSLIWTEDQEKPDLLYVIGKAEKAFPHVA